MPKIFLRKGLGARHTAIELYDILALKASSNYTIVKTRDDEWIYSVTLSDFEAKIKAIDERKEFIRINRSEIINRLHVDQIDGYTLYIAGQSYHITKQNQVLISQFNIF